MECLSLAPSLSLVDEFGQPASARGETRTSQAPLATQPFDCNLDRGPSGRADGPGWPFPADAGPGAACQDGIVKPPVFTLNPRDTVDVRFELADGSISDWQPVDIELTKHTDPDFNGPDCPCTWYDGTAAPIVVPADARLPEGRIG